MSPPGGGGAVASDAAHERLLRRSRWRVALLGSLVVVGILALLSAGVYLVARRTLYGELRDRLFDAAREMTVLPADAGGGRVLIVDSRGRPLGVANLSIKPDDQSNFDVVAATGIGGPLAALRLPRGSPWQFIATSARSEVTALGEFLRLLLALTLVGGVVALPTGYVLAGRALFPLEEAFRERTEFVALASHQLRTPLSVIRTAAELARDRRGMQPAEALATILDQAARMEALAARLTALARSQAGSHPGPVSTDLAAAAASVARGLAPAAAQAGGAIRVEADAPVWARVGADEVSDLLTALVENGIHHGDGRVAVRLGRDGAQAFAEVMDGGPGIPAEDLPHVTEPFYRGHTASGGQGLGLAIARAVTERRGGRLIIRSHPGDGTVVRVELPAAPAPSSSPTA